MKENPYRNDREEINDLIRLYENLRKGQSQSFLEEEAFIKIIEYFDEKDQVAKAIEAAEMGIQLYPYSPALFIKKADLLLSTQQYQEALYILREVELLDNRDINIYILKTDAYLALDKQEKAVKLLEKALSLFEGQERIELLFELADVYDDYGEFEKVFDCLKIILEEHPNNEEALHKICFWTDFTGRNEESIRLHQKIIDEYPYNELAWFNLGAAFQGLKLYEKSIEAYQYAITIDEKMEYAYRNMGDAFIRIRKYTEAIEVLEKVAELSRPDEVIFEAIGHCYDKLKKYAKARFNYRKSSHVNPTNPKLIYRIANTYFQENQWSACMKQLDMALKINRMNPDYHLLMGECKMKTGFFKEAVPYFSIVVRARPRNSAGWEALVRCLYLAEFTDDALEQVEAALRFTRQKPVFLFYKTAILIALGKSKEAILQLENAMRISPKMLKKLFVLSPSILQNQHVVKVLAGFLRKK